MVGNLDYAKAKAFPICWLQDLCLGMAITSIISRIVEEFVGKVGDRLSFLVKDAFSVLRDARVMSVRVGWCWNLI